MATLKAELKAILEKYEIDPRDKSKLWDCHGTLVLYHRAYEAIAAREKITFETPLLLEARSADRIVAMLVVGHMDERTEWSIGESAPANSKNAYPYAIAEKRGKDRVVGKLVGLAEYVYSEDEAEDFKEAQKSPAKPAQQQTERAGNYEAQAQTDAPTASAEHPRRQEALDSYNRIRTSIEDARTGADIDGLLANNRGDIDLIKEVHAPSAANLLRQAENRKREMWGVTG